MVSIECHDITKRYGQVDVLDRVTWRVPPGGVVGLLGGSGAGKTTLLRIIAGLTGQTSGNIDIGNASNGPRRVGMVFQGLALWPHLTALEHLKCVLSGRPGDRRRRAETLLAEARLPDAAWNHRPAQLSGGEAQRLALARALAIEPHILLLDEPLAHLDTPLRADLLEHLRGCLTSRPVTCVFVTHVWDEAAAICERIAVLDRGRLAQEGTPDDLYWCPANEEIAHLAGPVIRFPAAWLREGHLTTADRGSPVGLAKESETILVRPQQLAAIDADERNRWTVVECHPRGGGWSTTVTRAAERLSLLLPRRSLPGDTIGLELRPPG